MHARIAFAEKLIGFFQLAELDGFGEMDTSAYGIVEKAYMFRGVVRAPINIILMDDADEPIPNAKCKVTFQDGQTMLVESDGEGVLKFSRKAPGEFEIELLEEEKASKEGSKGEV